MNKYLKHMLCLGLMALNSSAYAQAPQPTGHWVKTWGAIAASVTETILGASVNANTQSEAEHLALTVKNKGGTACKVDTAYHNQCIAMVVGEKSYSRETATTVTEATWRALKDCENKNNRCGIFYLACTEPRLVKY